MHEQRANNELHALAVAAFFVVERVSLDDIEEVLLADALAVFEIILLRECSAEIFAYLLLVSASLTDVVGVNDFHLFVLAGREKLPAETAQLGRYTCLYCLAECAWVFLGNFVVVCEGCVVSRWLCGRTPADMIRTHWT